MTNIWDKNWKSNLKPDIHPELIDLIQKYSPGKKILEIGFGTGGDLEILSKIGFRCYGIESSKIAYHNAKKRGFAKIFFGDGVESDFKSSEFDLIFHQGVLEHFKNPSAFLTEQRRILKNNGYVVIDVPHKWNLFTIYKNVRIFFGKWYGGWERSYSADELRELIFKSGFEPVYISYRGIWPHQWGKFLFPERIVKNKVASKIISVFPFRLLRNVLRFAYDRLGVVKVVSSYNLTIVARKRRLRVGFDARYAEGDLVGVGKYINELLNRMSDEYLECFAFYSRPPKFRINNNVKAVFLNSENQYVFEQVLLPIALKKERIDLYHATGNMGIPILCTTSSVLTVHDLIPLETRDYFSNSMIPILSKMSYYLRLKTSFIKARKIVTVSKYVRECLVSNGVSKEKIEVIYSGSPRLPQSAKIPKFLIGKRFVLNNGGIDIRKNIDRLIAAFELVNKKHQDLLLIITGNANGMELKKAKSIIYTGYVKEVTMWGLIKNSELLCYPSLSEGFGFPVLEGFVAGVPVITSDTSSMPEIAGDAALLVNPKNVVDIADAMEKVIANKKIRSELVSRGRRQCLKFDWSKSCDAYLNLYNSLK